QAAQTLFGLFFHGEAEQRGEEGVIRVGTIRERVTQLGLQLEAHARLRVGDAKSEEAAQQLTQRVVRNRLCVGDALGHDGPRRAVVGPTAMPAPPACTCSRAAVLTVSPSALYRSSGEDSSSSTTTGPVLTPILATSSTPYASARSAA